jgi:hypothetical protein
VILLLQTQTLAPRPCNIDHGGFRTNTDDIGCFGDQNPARDCGSYDHDSDLIYSNGASSPDSLLGSVMVDDDFNFSDCAKDGFTSDGSENPSELSIELDMFHSDTFNEHINSTNEDLHLHVKAAKCDSGSDSDIDSNKCEELILEEDPLYRSHDDYLLPTDDLSDAECEAPPALSEHPAILNAYVHAWANAAYEGVTHDATRNILVSARSTIKTMLGASDPPDNLDLSSMAITLRTLEKCLGVDPDHLITYYALCQTCFKPYHPSNLSDMDDPSCTCDGCTDTIFEVKSLSSGVQKWVLYKTMPVASVRKALQNFMK